jgi:hypothetical protein
MGRRSTVCRQTLPGLHLKSLPFRLFFVYPQTKIIVPCTIPAVLFFSRARLICTLLKQIFYTFPSQPTRNHYRAFFFPFAFVAYKFFPDIDKFRALDFPFFTETFYFAFHSFSSIAGLRFFCLLFFHFFI